MRLGQTPSSPAESPSSKADQMLWSALFHEDCPMLAKALADGASPDCPFPCVGSPLAQAATSSSPEMVARLLCAGADLLLNGAGAAAVAAAVHRGNLAPLRLLAEAGAPLAAANANQASPLWIACSHHSPACAAFLLGQGADPNDRDAHSGVLAASLCALEGHDSILRLLLSHGADPMGMSNGGDCGFPAEESIALPCLHLAAQRGRAGCAVALLEWGADPLWRCPRGLDAAEVARLAGADDCAAAIEPWKRRAEEKAALDQAAKTAGSQPRMRI